ncbi:RICIN domain-containing protein [Streptomyces caelestis]|uniref:RICIN domain-containing protein n=1 Tax=Streptomyces caelestis TaxID=36816 RepID=UPI00160A6862|nr:RICIN domain-containing protein [Streptomyces caelestis]
MPAEGPLPHQGCVHVGLETNAWYVLVNRGSGKAVEGLNASTTDGARVVQYADWSGANQQWQLVRASGVLAQVHTAGRVR